MIVNINIELTLNKILELHLADLECQNIEIVAKIKEIVTDYISNNSKFEILDK